MHEVVSITRKIVYNITIKIKFGQQLPHYSSKRQAVTCHSLQWVPQVLVSFPAYGSVYNGPRIENALRRVGPFPEFFLGDNGIDQTADFSQ